MFQNTKLTKKLKFYNMTFFLQDAGKKLSDQNSEMIHI